jgi:hypothetical protein
MQPVGSGTDPGMTKSKTLPDDRPSPILGHIFLFMESLIFLITA